MSDLLNFKKTVIRGVGHHFKHEQDRAQYNVYMYSQYLKSYVASDDAKFVSVEFVEKTLELAIKELNVIQYYYRTPYAFAVKCLSEIQDLMQAPRVTYDMLSTIASCIFRLMKMSHTPYIRGVHRSVFCRWMWDNWCYTLPPSDHDSTWMYIYTIFCQFTLVLCTTQLPTHPEPLPEEEIIRQVHNKNLAM
jgi:hypothetical protein